VVVGIQKSFFGTLVIAGIARFLVETGDPKNKNQEAGLAWRRGIFFTTCRRTTLET
jgi:hypothetical protein